MGFAVEFFLRRISQGVVIVLLAALVVFTLLRVAPGNPVRIILGPMASQTQLQETAKKLGLTDPIPVQFGRFVIEILHGDLGQSYIRGKQGGVTGGNQHTLAISSRAEVSGLIWRALPFSLQLGGLGVLFSLVIALPIGIAAGLHAGRWQDRVGLYVSSLFVSLPNIWIGVVLIFLVSAKANLLPAIGYKGFGYTILPALTIALELSPVLMRTVSVAVAATLGETYVDAGKARGLSWRRVVSRHVLRNAAVPVLNLFGAQTIGLILGSLFVVEYIFSYPGLGLLTINAVFQRDFPLVQAVAVLAAAALVGINMLVDFASTMLDRRLKF